MIVRPDRSACLPARDRAGHATEGGPPAERQVHVEVLEVRAHLPRRQDLRPPRRQLLAGPLVMARHDQRNWHFDCVRCGQRLLSSRGVYCHDCRTAVRFTLRVDDLLSRDTIDQPTN